MNLRSFFLLMCFIGFFSLSACYKATLIDGEIPDDPNIDDPNVELPDSFVQWSLLDYEFERRVLNIFPSEFELYAITENQFVRFNKQLGLVEARTLDASTQQYGRPVFHPNVFSRISSDRASRPIIEFHLTKSAQDIRQFSVTDLRQDLSEHVEIDFQSYYPGAFNKEGRYFLLPARTFPNYHYTFFLFELTYDFTFSNFDQVRMIRRIDIPEMKTNLNNLSNIRFIDDAFYVTAKSGGYRITVEGEVTQLTNNWVLDIFKWQDKLYMTGFERFNFYSSDDGIVWQREDDTSLLKMVTVAGDKVFSQEVIGRNFKLANNSLTDGNDIRYNEDYSQDLDAFYAIDFYNEQYVAAIERSLYFVPKIVLQ